MIQRLRTDILSAARVVVSQFGCDPGLSSRAEPLQALPRTIKFTGPSRTAPQHYATRPLDNRPLTSL